MDIADCDEPRLWTDVCIVGAGAAGITLACELQSSKLSVVVLEGGGVKVEPAVQELNECEIAGLAHGGASTGRFRAFGGTTRRWAGQALPLSEMDFRRRDWVPYSGWPISRADLEPYYIRAARGARYRGLFAAGFQWREFDITLCAVLSTRSASSVCLSIQPSSRFRAKVWASSDNGKQYSHSTPRHRHGITYRRGGNLRDRCPGSIDVRTYDRP